MMFDQSTIDTIKTVIEYPPLQVAALVFVSTQWIKTYITEHNKTVYNSSLRVISGLIGILGGIVLIDFSLKGALSGLIISGVTTVAYKLLSLWLNRDSASNWEKKFAVWLSCSRVK